MRVFPFSIEMCISSPISGRPKKYRVGITLKEYCESGARRVGDVTRLPQITESLDKSLILLKDLGVVSTHIPLNAHSECLDLRIHHIRCHVRVIDVLSELASKLCLDLLELQRFEGSTWTSINLGIVPYDMGAKRFREPAHRLAKITLEKLHDR